MTAEQTISQTAHGNFPAQAIFVTVLAVFGGVASYTGSPGSVIALLPLGALLMLLQPLLLPSRLAKLTALLSLGSIAAVALQPGALNLAISWFSLGAFALAQRRHTFENLTATVELLAMRLLGQPPAEMQAVARLRSSPASARKLGLQHILLPALSIIVFAGLLSAANPVIQGIIEGISLRPVQDALLSWSPLVALASFLLIRALLRTSNAAPAKGLGVDTEAPGWHARYFSPTAVVLTLLSLNLLFLAQNALDFSYLWQGTALPPGMTYASYVHRGAYALIITALAAGALVIFALWPASKTETSPVVRGLVYLWISQNVLLVLSSVARTLSYVDAYGLTLMRLSGLIWMALVAVGLVLIALRIVFRRSNLWLLNRNMLAAFATLWAVSFADLAAITANYNVDHALQRPASEPLRFDYAYVQSLGPSAIPALCRLDAELLARARAINPAYPAPLAGSAILVRRQLQDQQSDWRRWTLRHAWIAAGE
jgi:Domain of unknown function (DUF4173)